MDSATSNFALDLGIGDGVQWATTHCADRARLGRIVRAHAPGEVMEIIGEGASSPADVEDTVAYWSGFAHGVGRVIRETADPR